jgi:hypothetical protein
MEYYYLNWNLETHDLQSTGLTRYLCAWKLIEQVPGGSILYRTEDPFTCKMQSSDVPVQAKLSTIHKHGVMLLLKDIYKIGRSLRFKTRNSKLFTEILQANGKDFKTYKDFKMAASQGNDYILDKAKTTRGHERHNLRFFAVMLQWNIAHLK